MKLSADKCRFRAEHLDAQVGEFELAHVMAGTLIVILVAIERRLPAFRFMRS